MKKWKHLCLGLAAAACLCAATAAIAQQQDPPLVVRQLKPDLYWTEGGNGGNTGFVIGKTGVIVVDAKGSADSAKQVLAEIAKLTPKPVTHVILTHSDGDHVNGLAAYPAGVIVVAQENNKKEQEAAIAAGGRGAPPADHLPSMLVTKQKEAHVLDGVKVELYHWGPAHTSGDLVVYFPQQKVVFGGDVIATNRPDPRIHEEKNGSSEGIIATMMGIAGLDADTFVPGHGGIQTKAFVQDRAGKLQEKRKTIAAMVKQGKSLDQIKAAVGDNTSPAPAGGAGAPAAPTFTESVYNELTKK